MNQNPTCHLWVRGGRRTDRAAAIAALDLPPQAMPPVHAHRRLRGPYTAAGSIARSLTPTLLEQDAELVRRHDLELLSVAPELSAVVPNSRETLASLAIPAERTRFYARLRTRRISNGLVEFLLAALGGSGRRTLVVEDVDAAEPTDVEFLAAALRRADPARLTLVLCTAGSELPDPALAAALTAHARVLEVETAAGGGAPGPGSYATDDLAAATAYVWSDGTADDPRLLSAYEAVDHADRARLHQRRAEELQARDEQSLSLGAIPYHLEHGTDPGGAGAQALYDAEDHCLCLGFYDATVDLGRRGLRVIDPADEIRWWMFTVEIGLALSLLGRTREALEVYDQARLRSTLPAVHMGAAYSTAMLYTRHNEPEERDQDKAKAWLNSAIATASLLEDASDRAFQSAFYKNGLALVEVNLGDPAEALRLVDECIESLDRDLAPHEHRLHRTVLKNNRARVYAMLGRFPEALADYAVVIGADPNHAEHYLERAGILRRLGRFEEALADYATALRLSPPFPEIYYNRGDLLLSLGERDAARADLTYVLELEPDFVDAYVNVAGMQLEDGELDEAWRSALAGLQRDPDNPHLHTVLGQVLAERGEHERARAALDRALAGDPGLVPALAARAAVAEETGDRDGALADLDRAVAAAPDDPVLRYNRACVLTAAGRAEEALPDLELAAAGDPADPDIAEALGSCRRTLARVA
jgi:tetratricopeptide (TPR) repeat protein